MASPEMNILIVKSFHIGEGKNYDLNFGEKSRIKSHCTVQLD